MLTVLIATHNGAQTLPTVLDAYCNLEVPNGGWKLLVVNNASTDRTQEILDSYQSRLPLRAISESAVGKSRALNTGLAYVEGDLVVMTDDDTVPSSDWLVQYRKAADARPTFAVFGGVILPRWEVPPVSWMLPYYGTFITDPTLEEGPIYATGIYGPNMAIRTQVIEAGHRFDISMGPMGSKYQMGDETDFLLRVNKNGFECWHVKQAIVEHIIRKCKMTNDSMLHRAQASGWSEYRREYFYDEHLHPPALLLGMPRYVIREIIEQSFRVARTRLTQGEEKAFAERWRLRFLIGRALGGRDLYKFRDRHEGC